MSFSTEDIRQKFINIRTEIENAMRIYEVNKKVMLDDPLINTWQIANQMVDALAPKPNPSDAMTPDLEELNTET